MRYVKYIGLSHQRIITPHDWRTVGINAETAVWNAQNGFAVPLDHFSEDQVRKAIEPDSNFVVTGDDEEFVPAPQVTDMTPSQAAQAAEAPVDVVAFAETGSNVSTTGSGASGAPGSASPTTVGRGTGSGHDES